MATTTVFSLASDGVVYSDDGSFANARAGSAITANDTFADMVEGSNTGYRCHQMAMAFDVSGLVGQVVSAAQLSLFDEAGLHINNHIAQARGYNWGGTLTTADFVAGATFAALDILATFDLNGAGPTSEAYNAFTENGTLFRDYVQAAIGGSGIVYIIVNSDQFAAGNAPPGGGEYWIVYTSDAADAGKHPKLVLTHADAASSTGPATGLVSA